LLPEDSALPYIYDVTHDGTLKFLSTSGTANTELANLQLKQAVRNFFVNAYRAQGRGVAMTTLTGITFVARRWTTVGSLGTAAVPAPRRRDAPAAATGAATSVDTAITAGTVSGAIQASFGCGAAGPGGWTARDDSSKIMVEAGSADEITVHSIQGGGTALNFSLDAEIEE
jgi:hypothetical protein